LRCATLECWRALAAVGAPDLSLAKLFEGHTDALAILHQAAALTLNAVGRAPVACHEDVLLVRAGTEGRALRLERAAARVHQRAGRCPRQGRIRRHAAGDGGGDGAGGAAAGRLKLTPPA
jgi:hypothetical protein